jgi:hypothetical protein
MYIKLISCASFLIIAYIIKLILKSVENGLNKGYNI